MTPGLVGHDAPVEDAWLVVFRCATFVVEMRFPAHEPVGDFVGCFGGVWAEFVDEAIGDDGGVHGVVCVHAEGAVEVD